MSGGSAGGWWARRGVRQRSTIVAVLVVSFALSLGGLALVVVLSNELTDSVAASVTQRTQDVAAQIVADDIDAATPTINASTGDGTLIQIIDASGAVVLSSPSIEGEPAMLPVGDLSGGRQNLEMPLPFVDNAPYLVATVPASTSVGPVVVVGAQSLVQVQRVAQLVTVSLLIGAPILLLAVGWVTWWAVGRSLSSVDRIRARVEGIGAQDLGERVPVPPAEDEISALAVTMNHMLDRLEGSAIMQRRFVADASHELKSPLASMRASLDTARSGGAQDPWPVVEPVLSDEVDRMGRLVADLLLLAKADEGQLVLRLVEVDLDDLAAAEASRVRAQTNLTVHSDIVAARVIGDPDRLGQALRNLVDNAVRFAASQIQVGVAVSHGGALLSVADDGPGIPEEDREAVLGRFVRGDEHRARHEGGAGLGLAITAEIAKLHGGHLVVGQSPELGGAQVGLWMPSGSGVGVPTGSSR